MARHFYHIPLQNTLHFIKNEKSFLNTLTNNTKTLEYHKQLGKSHYMLQIESFMGFFKIDTNLDYALKSLTYFNSTIFMAELGKILNFSQFNLESHHVTDKAFFYALCYLYSQKEPEVFEHFIQKTLLHYHTAFNQASDIHIDHQEICRALAKNRNMTLRESFGEESEAAFFKLYLNGKLQWEERGKRIKTLRKKAYKKLFYQLLDEDEVEM